MRMKEHGTSDDAVVTAVTSFVEKRDLMHLLPDVLEQLERQSRLSHTEEGLVVTTAQEVDDSLIAAIKERISAPDDVEVSAKQDPTLVGGFIARYGGKEYASFVDRDLKRLERELAH